ncbi:MAG: hypothetical protein ACRDDF_00950, partial [Aeromonas sp.]
MIDINDSRSEKNDKHILFERVTNLEKVKFYGNSDRYHCPEIPIAMGVSSDSALSASNAFSTNQWKRKRVYQNYFTSTKYAYDPEAKTPKLSPAKVSGEIKPGIKNQYDYLFFSKQRCNLSQPRAVDSYEGLDFFEDNDNGTPCTKEAVKAASPEEEGNINVQDKRLEKTGTADEYMLSNNLKQSPQNILVSGPKAVRTIDNGMEQGPSKNSVIALEEELQAHKLTTSKSEGKPLNHNPKTGPMISSEVTEIYISDSSSVDLTLNQNPDELSKITQTISVDDGNTDNPESSFAIYQLKYKEINELSLNNEFSEAFKKFNFSFLATNPFGTLQNIIKEKEKQYYHLIYPYILDNSFLVGKNETL